LILCKGYKVHFYLFLYRRNFTSAGSGLCLLFVSLCSLSCSLYNPENRDVSHPRRQPASQVACAQLLGALRNSNTVLSGGQYVVSETQEDAGSRIQQNVRRRQRRITHDA